MQAQATQLIRSFNVRSFPFPVLDVLGVGLRNTYGRRHSSFGHTATPVSGSLHETVWQVQANWPWKPATVTTSHNVHTL